ncbi:MAG: sulfotransferase [Wenzhouxiangella sp.]|nr:sulfotransferase [Wenzhouxiangella sp.]TVR94920.1 MAG: sulfotransferase [Wenzhouxiangellaceae bacterium]
MSKNSSELMSDPDPDRSPVFILGIRPRCGSNFLFDLLRLHPCLSTHPSLAEDFLLAEADQLAGYVDKTRAHWDERWGFSPSAGEDLLRHLGTGALAFLQSGLGDDNRRLLSKTPEVSQLPLFFKLFPQARLLLLVRDGRAVVESSLRSFDTSFDWQVSAWNSAARTILDFCRQTPPTRFRLVHYENLVQHTHAELTGILEFLRLDPKRFPFEQAEALPVRGSSELARDGADLHWRPVSMKPDFDPLARFAHWSDDQHRAFNAIAGESLEALGYRARKLEAATGFANPLLDQDDSEELYCSIDHDFVRHDAQLALVTGESDQAKALMPYGAANALFALGYFRSTKEHAAALAKLGIPHEAALALQKDYLRSGFLLKASTVRDSLAELTPAASEHRRPVRFLVVRTCERPELLSRLLDSAVDQLHRHALSLLVIDDSRRDAAAARNEQAVQRLGQQHGVTAIYFGTGQQLAFIKRLAAALPEHEAAIRYGLAPRPEGLFTAGRLINLANLLLAGQPYLLYDDDYLLHRQLSHPETDRASAVISNAPDLVMQGFDSGEEMAGLLDAIGSDPLAEHIELLGCSLGELMHLEPFVGMTHAGLWGLSREACKRLGSAAQVTTTGNGACGRPLAPDARAALQHRYRRTRPTWAAPKSHAAWMRGHFIYKSHRSASLTDLTHETPVGVDNSRIMPPTIPVGRREDTLFTLLIRHAHQSALHLEFPWTIEHWREARDWSEPTLNQPERLSLAGVMCESLELSVPGRGTEQYALEFLKTTGAYASQISRSGQHSMRQRLASLYRQVLAVRIEEAEKYHDGLGPEAASVRHDLERIIAVNRQALQSHSGPPLWEDRQAPTTMGPQLEWVSGEFASMGRLLQAWPELWQHCKDQPEPSLFQST